MAEYTFHKILICTKLFNGNNNYDKIIFYQPLNNIENVYKKVRKFDPNSINYHNREHKAITILL